MARIRGLDIYAQHFTGYSDQYVLIGGVASWLTMDEAGLPFRATRDLDIVLVIEALNTEFVQAFWDFIQTGGYRIKEIGRSGEQRPVFYRFQHPQNEDYPVQIELFSRAPAGFEHPDHATLTPIPTDEAVSSLSAILLDTDYYHFLLAGRQHNQDITYIGADRLIPLKAHAWLDLTARKQAGEQVDSKHIRKHRNDVLLLSGQLTEDPIELPDSIRKDLGDFLELVDRQDMDLKSIGLKGKPGDYLARLRTGFGLS